MDRMTGLQGVCEVFCAMADIDMNDKVPCKHKQLFVDTFLLRMTKCSRPLPRITRDGSLDWDACACYKYDGEKDGKYTKVVHWRGKSIAIPSDYSVSSDGSWSITHNYSSTLAIMKGTRAQQNLWELFEEQLGDEWTVALLRETEMEGIVAECATRIGLPVEFAHSPGDE